MLLVSLPYRQLTWKSFGNSFLDAVKTASMILVLIFGARYFSNFLTSSNIASSISEGILDAGLHKYAVMFMVAAVLLDTRLPDGHLVGDDHHPAHLLRPADQGPGLRPAADWV